MPQADVVLWVRYFHVTARAEAILAEGFRDAEGSYGLVGATLRGVFISDQPVGVEEVGVALDELRQLETLLVELPDDLDLSDWELVEEGSPPGWRREWCIPAEVLNRKARVSRPP